MLKDFIAYLAKNSIIRGWLEYYQKKIVFLDRKNRKYYPQPNEISKVKNIGKTILITLLVLIVVFIFAIFFQMPNPFDPKQYQLDVKPGMSSLEIAKALRQADIIKSRRSFNFLVNRFGFDNKIKAGRYTFSKHDPLIMIIFDLVSGKSRVESALRITFPEGMSVYKMSLVLKENKIAWADDFANLTTLEGYLYPDTYYIDPVTSDMNVLVNAMRQRFDEVVGAYWASVQGSTKLSFKEVVILASIIEKEAKVPAERPLISSVFHNRLDVGMPLAADPTIKYALDNPTKKVYLDQLMIKSPYNTYKRRGLPPGPICNPGIESVKAAIFPANTQFLYFVANKDGSHIFSKTYAEHQKARQKVK